MITFGIENCKINDVDIYVQNIINKFELDHYDADIDIRFVKKCDGDAGGYCFGDEDEVEIEIATHVQGEPLSFKTILVNLAHEMVHAKQIITGQLIDHGLKMATTDDGGVSLIKSSTWEGVEHTDTPYDEQPWEIEAYALERQVYDECFK